MLSGSIEALKNSTEISGKNCFERKTHRATQIRLNLYIKNKFIFLTFIYAAYFHVD